MVYHITHAVVNILTCVPFPLLASNKTAPSRIRNILKKSVNLKQQQQPKQQQQSTPATSTAAVATTTAALTTKTKTKTKTKKTSSEKTLIALQAIDLALQMAYYAENSLDGT